MWASGKIVLDVFHKVEKLQPLLGAIVAEQGTANWEWGGAGEGWGIGETLVEKYGASDGV